MRASGCGWPDSLVCCLFKYLQQRMSLLTFMYWYVLNIIPLILIVCRCTMLDTGRLCMDPLIFLETTRLRQLIWSTNVDCTMVLLVFHKLTKKRQLSHGHSLLDWAVSLCGTNSNLHTLHKDMATHIGSQRASHNSKIQWMCSHGRGTMIYLSNEVGGVHNNSLCVFRDS